MQDEIIVEMYQEQENTAVAEVASPAEIQLLTAHEPYGLGLLGLGVIAAGASFYLSEISGKKRK